MQRIRNVLADALVGIVLVVVAFWMLRGVFKIVYWGVTAIIVVLVVAFVFRIAGKLRG